MADQDARALLLTIQANTELLRSNLSAAEKAIGDFATSTQTHLDKSDARFETLGKGIEKLEGPLERLKAIGEGAFAFLVGESLIEKGKQALEFAGNVQFMATQIGVSTDFLQKFRYAASQSGASIEVTDTSLIKFSRSVGEAANGNTKLVKLFNDLGVGVLDASGKTRSVEGVYKDTADAIAKIEAPAQRTADTLALFGRGAGALVPLLSGGSAGFNQLAAAAQQLGIVLNPEMIEHAEDVNHKLAALKLILDAQMASAVAQNAAAIGQLAGQFVSLAGGVAQFMSHNPREAFAIIGGLVGLRVGGLPGLAIGAVAGTAIGNNIDKEDRDASLDQTIRAQDLLRAKREYHEAADYKPTDQLTRDGIGGPPAASTNASAAYKQYVYQFGLYRKARAQGFAAKPEEPNLGSNEAGDHNPAPKAKDDHAAEKEATRRKAVIDKLAQLDDQALSYQSQLTSDLGEQLAFAQQKINTDEARQIADVNQGVLAGKITAEEAKELKAKIERNADLAAEALDRKAAEAAEALSFKHAAEELDLTKDLLGSQILLATTRKDRLALELKQLNAEREADRTRLTKTINDRDPAGNLLHSDSDIAIAQQQLRGLDKRYDAKTATTNAQEQSPLDAYRKQLRSTVGDTNALNDSLQNVAVDGLKGMEDALVGVVNGTKSVAEAFKDMASSIVSDLLRIAAEKAIFSLLGFNAGGGVGSSSGAGGNAGYGSDVDIAALGFAVGGVINGPGSGTSDSILARLSNGEFVINAQATSKHLGLLRAINDNALPGFAAGGAIGPIVAPSIGPLAVANSGAAVHLHLDFKGAVVTQDLINDASQKALAAYTESVKHTNRSIAGLSRRTL